MQAIVGSSRFALLPISDPPTKLEVTARDLFSFAERCLYARNDADSNPPFMRDMRACWKVGQDSRTINLHQLD